MATHKHTKKAKEVAATDAEVSAPQPAPQPTSQVPMPTLTIKEPTQPVKANDGKPSQQETKTKMNDYTQSLFEYSQDLANVEAPEPLPPNEYPVVIEKAELIQSKQGAGPLYLVLGCRVMPDDYPADFIDGDPDGTYMTWYAVRVEDNAQGRWRMKKFKLRCGLQPTPVLDPTEFLGLKIAVLTAAEEYEGEKRPSIKRLVGES